MIITIIYYYYLLLLLLLLSLLKLKIFCNLWWSNQKHFYQIWNYQIRSFKKLFSFVSFHIFVTSAWNKYQTNDSLIFESAHDKNCNKIIVTSKDSDQPVHPPSMARVPIYPSLDSLKAVKDTCDQRRLRSDCADAQADRSLRWSHKSYCRFCMEFSLTFCTNSTYLMTVNALCKFSLTFIERPRKKKHFYYLGIIYIIA